jgi:PKD repeat protein
MKRTRSLCTGGVFSQSQPGLEHQRLCLKSALFRRFPLPLVFLVACCLPAWAVQVRLKVVDQNRTEIPGSQICVDGAAAIPTGTVASVDEGVHTLTLYPGLNGRSGSRDLWRAESVFIEPTTTEVVFEWIMVPVTVDLVDQGGRSIPGSSMHVDNYGQWGAEDWQWDQLPAQAVMPVNDPSVYSVMGGSYAVRGYWFGMFPGLNGRSGSRDLARAESVFIKPTTTEVVFEWIMVPVTVDLVDQAGQSIPGSSMHVDNYGQWGAEDWQWDQLPAQAVMPVNDPSVYSVMGGSYAVRGYWFGMCPGLNGQAHCGDLARAESVFIKPTTRKLTFPWISTQCPLWLVDTTGQEVLGSTFLFNGAQYRNGDPLQLPVTDEATYPILSGEWVTGYPITVMPSDANGVSGTFPFRVLPANVFQPELFMIAGKSYRLRCGCILPPKLVCPGNFTVAAPGAGGAVVTYQVQATAECGAVSVVCTPPSGSTFPVGVTTVNCTAADTAGNNSSCSFTVTVDGPPVVSAISAPIDPVQVNTPISAAARFTDIRGSHYAVWDWGDGSTPTTGTITEQNGSGTVTGGHTYTAAGVYTITLTVTDRDGNTGQAVYQFMVVYNPDGGFVTGGGWITSPAGAYRPDPSLTGKATFGFNSKYNKGATVPTGQTQFDFHAGGLGFHSESYEWLVISGAKARYKGSGTINGSGDYGFILIAIDGQVNGGGGVDKFRIKIWEKATGHAVVYDNELNVAEDADPTTVVGGGSIVIHKEK